MKAFFVRARKPSKHTRARGMEAPSREKAQVNIQNAMPTWDFERCLLLYYVFMFMLMTGIIGLIEFDTSDQTQIFENTRS